MGLFVTGGPGFLSGRGGTAARVALALAGLALDAAFYAPPLALGYLIATGRAAAPSAEAPAPSAGADAAPGSVPP